MPPKETYILSPLALLDLEEIGDYISLDSIEHAQQVLYDLREHMKKIASSPGIGRKRPEFSSNQLVAFWPALRYLIVYRPESQPVEILRVLHTSRNVSLLLDEL